MNPRGAKAISSQKTRRLMSKSKLPASHLITSDPSSFRLSWWGCFPCQRVLLQHCADKPEHLQSQLSLESPSHPKATCSSCPLTQNMLVALYACTQPHSASVPLPSSFPCPSRGTEKHHPPGNEGWHSSLPPMHSQSTNSVLHRCLLVGLL